jgi:channel protein (hemolysin III family)
VPPERHLVSFAGLSEPLSSSTHMVAAILALVLAPLMLRRTNGDRQRSLACAIYLATMGAMYGISSVYHGLGPGSALRPLFWRLDHASIWLVLAATFVTIRVLMVDGRFQLAAQGPLWAAAFTGATLELSVIDRLPLFVSPLLYVCMGWLGFPTLLTVGKRVGWNHAGTMLAGGLLATLGGFMDASDRPCFWPGVIEAHELLHVATTVGGALFWCVVFGAADGHLAPALVPVHAAAPSIGADPVAA